MCEECGKIGLKHKKGKHMARKGFTASRMELSKIADMPKLGNPFTEKVNMSDSMLMNPFMKKKMMK